MITDWEASAWEIEQPVVNKKSEQKWGQKYIKHKTLPNIYISTEFEKADVAPQKKKKNLIKVLCYSLPRNCSNTRLSLEPHIVINKAVEALNACDPNVNRSKHHSQRNWQAL